MRLLTASLIVAATVAFAADASAQSRVTIVPSASFSTVFDDNIFAKPTGAGDTMALLTPSLEGSYEGPRADFLGQYSFDMQRSADHPVLNTFEVRRRAMFDSHMRTTPKLTLGLGGHYDRSEMAGELNFETGLLLERARAQRLEGTPSFVYQANPVITVRGLYDWTRETLAGSISANEHTARFSVSRALSTRTSTSIGYVGRHFINGIETQTSHAALFGWNRALGPFSMLTLQAGPRLSSSNRLAPEIVASLARRPGNYIGYSLDYWRGESIILGVLGPVEVNSATGKFSWPVRRNVELATHVGLFNSVSLTQGQARVYHGELVASWTPHEHYSIAVSYGADFQHGDIRTSLLSDRNVTRHVVLVKVTAAPRLSRLIQPKGPVEPLAAPSRGTEP